MKVSVGDVFFTGKFGKFWGFIEVSDAGETDGIILGHVVRRGYSPGALGVGTCGGFSAKDLISPLDLEATVPELFELAWRLAHPNEYGDPTPEQFAPIREMARAAIAKARGEA